MSEPLDPAVAVALNRAGLRVRSFHCISSIRAPETGRTVYRIDLVSGVTIKARRLQDEETACRLFEIRRGLPDAFAPAFHQYGAVVLEEWIEGEVLGERAPSDGHLIKAGALLADLHAEPAVAGRPAHEMRGTAAWSDEAGECLRQIVAAGAFDRQEALLLHQALQRLDPQRATYGLVHLDFCGENMVIDRTGRLRVVDNERIGVGALGFDLARTWYRWALPSEAWDRFLSAYVARMPLAEPVETLGFWSIVAVVKSAALRLRMDQGRAHVPFERLRRMVGELGGQPAPCRGWR
jgi:aminoglycoside phosphotransferase (APT) family kinase protein